MQAHARRARGSRLSPPHAGRACDDRGAARDLRDRQRADSSAAIEDELDGALAEAAASRPRSRGAQKHALFDLAQDGAQVDRLRAAVRHLRLPRRRRRDGGLLPRRSASIHTHWPMVPGRFKDYISTPKQNDYRSIHTTVVGPGQQRVELQIRTARWTSRRDTASPPTRSTRTAAALDLRDAGRREPRLSRGCGARVELLAEGDSPEEFLEHTKLELFHDQVFCFTPKGRLIALPRGATPIDFAYAVHTDVGNTAVGAKINGRIAPLLSRAARTATRSRSSAAEGQMPPAAWESARRDRQGAGRHPPRHARCRARAICRSRPADRRCAPSSGPARPSRGQAQGRAAASGPRDGRGRARGGRARRDVLGRRGQGRSTPTSRTSAQAGAAAGQGAKPAGSA